MQISQLNGNPLVMGGEALLDTYYPIGRIYFSTVNVSPASFMGGSWTRIQDRFLLCAGTVYAAGTTGGEASVTLSAAQMPNHTHVEYMHIANVGERPLIGGDGGVSGFQTAKNSAVAIDGAYQRTGSSGGGQAHNNMPPYRAVYAWGRVA